MLGWLVLVPVVGAGPDPVAFGTELDCHLKEAAVEFATARWQGAGDISAAVADALHLELCPSAGTPRAAPTAADSMITPAASANHAAAVPITSTDGDRNASAPAPGGASREGDAVIDTVIDAVIDTVIDAVSDAVTVYVAVATGDDRTGDGTVGSPWKSIGRARDHLRSLSPSGRAGATVVIRAGTYYEYVELTAADSAPSPEAPVTFRAHPGEAVTLSGGAPLDLKLRWQPYRHPDGGTAYQAQLPTGAAANFTGLFVDGRRAVLARYPNGNPEDVTGRCTAGATCVAAPRSEH